MNKEAIIDALKQGNPEPWLTSNPELKEDHDILKQVILNYDKLIDIFPSESLKEALPKNTSFFKALRSTLFSSLEKSPELKQWKTRMHFSELLSMISNQMDLWIKEGDKISYSPDRGLINLNRIHRVKQHGRTK